jgi:hypothetical protein
MTFKGWLYLLFFTAISCKAQKLRTEIPDAGWGEGSIMLNDGSEIKGLVKYNDRTSILSFQKGEESHSYTAKGVLGFEYFEETSGKQRVYFSLEHEDPQTSIVRPLFFELLRQFKTFAVLSLREQLEARVKSYAAINSQTNPIATNTNHYIALEQTETLYLMHESGMISKYLELTTVETAGLFRDERTKKKLVGEDLLESYTAPFYNDLAKFAKDNNLSFRLKDEFLQIMDHYLKIAEKD